MDYVCGFVFDSTLRKVLLKLKRRGPVQMAGKLNGIGGKIEPGETPLQAMDREFAEEVARFGAAPIWKKFHRMQHTADTKDGSAGNVVHFFTATAYEMQLRMAVSPEDEPVTVVSAWSLLTNLTATLPDGYVAQPVYNLAYLLPMARVYLEYPEYRWTED